MKDIDFLPAKYHEAAAVRQAKWWRMAVIAAFAAIIGIAAVGQLGIQRHVRNELEALLPQYNAALQETQRLAQADQSLRTGRAEAELMTYLRHPWPRTQILAHVMDPLPETITLKSLSIRRETPPATPSSSTVTETTKPATATAPTSKPPAAESDLQRLRTEIEASQIVVMLGGTTEDITTLHMYLGKLASQGFFAKVEIASIESAPSDKRGISDFSVRLFVRPGYGQRGGPVWSETEGSANKQAAHAGQGSVR